MRLTKGDSMNDAATTENTRLALQRIVALLFALAGLAERAAAAPRRIRWTVLFALCLAEAAASSFAADCAPGAPARFPASAFFQSGDRPVDAVLLAERFRALARLLDDISEYACPGEPPRYDLHVALACRACDAAGMASRTFLGLAVWSVRAPDTS